MKKAETKEIYAYKEMKKGRMFEMVKWKWKKLEENYLRKCGMGKKIIDSKTEGKKRKSL